jgi:alkaline phosphatase
LGFPVPSNISYEWHPEFIGSSKHSSEYVAREIMKSNKNIKLAMLENYKISISDAQEKEIRDAINANKTSVLL